MSRIVSVFCGAGGKMSQELKNTAFDIGYQLATKGYSLVTGGANVGMMKEVVDGHIKGDVTAQRQGVIPIIFREFNIHHTGIGEDNLLWTDDVHGRLKKFYDLADDIIVLPGGFGTLHELMDCLVHIQFNLITKRVFLLNINSFWDHTLAQFAVMVRENAVHQSHVDNLIPATSVADLITKIQSDVGYDMVQGIETQRWDTE